MLPALLLSVLAAGPSPLAPVPHLQETKPQEDAESPIITRAKAAVGPKGAGRPFLLVVSMTVKEGRANDLIKAYRAAAVSSLAEEGCTSYALTRDAENPNAFLLYERWKSTDALATHLEQPYTKAFVGAFGELLEESSVTVMRPVTPKAGGRGRNRGGAPKVEAEAADDVE
ncbi:putative quinol monooxygenase [Alienimonas chondri]|uniref:ABM domain-containing protein n=1 Tax=Alienimonas chondri TaxID=2681879 RepID=A0ABX1VI70_9PLAN|nr:putative quinol monooxygenase [Alienimonas chondri]NNJ27807.1 hypothetical protein [Alienimonas chondri]